MPDAGNPEGPVVAVLAGGMATRLGGAKASAILAGRPLIAYPLRAAREAGLTAIVVAKAGSPLPPVEVETVVEPEIPSHPLVGIITALRRAEGRPVLALACDLPLVGPELLRWLADRPERLVVPSIAGRLQPLAARYSPGLLPDLEAAMEGAGAGGDKAGAISMQGLVRSLGPRLVGESELTRFGDPERLFTNVNDPGDLRRAAGFLDSFQGGAPA